MNWTNTATNQTGFSIDQATNSGFTQGLTTVMVGANATSYNETGLSSDTTYYYRVRATNAIGSSANSPTVSATTGILGTLSSVPVPDGNFSSDAPNYYINGNNSGGLAFTSPMTATLTGWTISAIPSNANGGLYNGWEPYGAVDSVTSSGAGPFQNNAPWVGNQPASSYQAFMYYPGELYNSGSVVGGAQPVAKLTMTTTGISVNASTGYTYAATIQYANVSWASAADNNSANVELEILANGVPVGSGTLSGLAQNGPWTTVTASWVCPSTDAGQAIQLQVVATNFLEGPANYNQFEVPSFGFTDATLSATLPGAPAAPSALAATVASSSEIDLRWTDNSGGIATGFAIDQATSSDFSQGLTTATVGAGVTTYSATGLSADTTYYYRVRAIDAAGDSANSSTVSATTLPAASSGLTATATSSSQIDLNWTNTATNLTGFQIDQATNSAFTQGVTMVTVAGNVTSYNETGLSSDTTYYYRVRATNAVGSSANTPTVSAATGILGTPSPVPVPDGNFSLDAPNYYVNGNNSGGLTFTSPMTGTLAGWDINATPSTANGGLYSGWEPYGLVDNVTSGSGATPFDYSNVAAIGNQPSSTYNAFLYYPGEQYADGSVVGGAQPVADLTMTTTGINLTAQAGNTYTATIQYANVSQSNCATNSSANVALNILANGVVVSSGTLSGLAQNSPWTTVTVSWVPQAANAGQSIQLQVVATNFLEGPGAYQQWQVPTFGLANATLTAIASVATWKSSDDGVWNSATNWTTTQGIGVPGFSGVSGDQANFNGAGGLNVDLGNFNPSIAGLTFGPQALNYNIKTSTGTGTLQLNTGSSNATVTVSAGSQTISAPVELQNNVNVSVAVGASLTISGGISESGGSQALMLFGGGTMTLSGTDNYSNGTVVTAGSLIVAAPTALSSGSSLLVARVPVAYSRQARGQRWIDRPPLGLTSTPREPGHGPRRSKVLGSPRTRRLISTWQPWTRFLARFGV